MSVLAYEENGWRRFTVQPHQQSYLLLKADHRRPRADIKPHFTTGTWRKATCPKKHASLTKTPLQREKLSMPDQPNHNSAHS